MDNKKILVLGGTGAMGRYLVPELLDLGYCVDVVALDEPVSNNPKLRYLKGNGKSVECLKEFLKNEYDCIVDFMTYLVGSMLRKRSNQEKSTLLQELVDNVWPKIESGEIKPSVYKVLPFEQANEAQDILERGENIGKVVLHVGD